MSKDRNTWKPDDTFHDIIDGEYKGVLRVKEALRELKMTLGDKVVTSRDTGMTKLHAKLRRTTLPDGFEQWQLPIILGGGDRPVMSFITVCQPHATVPDHAHYNDCLFRIVLSGSIFHDADTELTSGDWVYIPQGVSYHFAAGRYGSVIMHLYNGTGLYWHQKQRSPVHSA